MCVCVREKERERGKEVDETIYAYLSVDWPVKNAYNYFHRLRGRSIYICIREGTAGVSKRRKNAGTKRGREGDEEREALIFKHSTCRFIADSGRTE